LFNKLFHEFDIPFTPSGSSLLSRAKTKLLKGVGINRSPLFFEAIDEVINNLDCEYQRPQNLNAYFTLIHISNIKRVLK